MPTFVLTNARIVVGPYELSGQMNSINLNYEAEMKDDTVFGTAGTRSNKPGLKNLAIQGSGFWDSSIDQPRYDRIGANREVATVSSLGQAEGDRCFFTRGVDGAYNPLSGEVGELVGFELDMHAADTQLVRGAVGATGIKTASGNSVGVQLGAIGALQRFYAALHALDPITGTLPTLDVTIESDDNSGFTTPTTQVTFAQVTTVPGAQWATPVVGPITDDWWRVVWTISGTLPSYPILVSFGIY